MNIAIINQKIGVISEKFTNDFIKKNEYTDATTVSVPNYIDRIAKSPYGGDVFDDHDGMDSDYEVREILEGNDRYFGSYSISLTRDLQSSSLMVEQVEQAYKDVLLKLETMFGDHVRYATDVLGLSSNDLSRMGVAKIGYLKQLCKANLKEISKRQVLVGSPTLHHGCSDGDHFNNKSLDEVTDDDIFYKVAIVLADYLRSSKGMTRADHYTLPLGTSQGLICKSRRDSPEFRAFSKALQGRYAQLCENESQLYELVKDINNLFSSYGYSMKADSFFLGKRKQHAAKDELIDTGDDLMPVTRHYQGRVRGIFPPPELFKVYYKPFSDGLKKTLFGKTAICSVDEGQILNSMVRSFAHYKDQVDKEESAADLHPFYDLSAYDRNTNRKLGSAYQVFLKRAFDAFEQKEGKNFQEFNLLFPSNISRHAPMLSQSIKYRSTLSGQPDVTVKNNIVHLIMIISALHELKTKRNGGKQSDIKKIVSCVIDGGVDDVLGRIDGKIHGDDAFLFFDNMNSDDVTFIHDYITGCGVPCAPEDAQVYLKKTLDPEYVIGRRATARMTNITGSVFRNRFGEYSVTDPFVGLMGLIDTIRKIPEPDRYVVWPFWHASINYYRVIAEHRFATGSIKIDDVSDVYFSVMSDVDVLSDAHVYDKKIEDISNRLMITLSKLLNHFLMNKSTQANSLRMFLSRLYYSNQEQFEVDELAELYGSLHYTSDSLKSDLKLSKLNRLEIKEIILSVQEELLKRDGDYTIPDEWRGIGSEL